MQPHEGLPDADLKRLRARIGQLARRSIYPTDTDATFSHRQQADVDERAEWVIETLAILLFSTKKEMTTRSYHAYIDRNGKTFPDLVDAIAGGLQSLPPPPSESQAIDPIIIEGCLKDLAIVKTRPPVTSFAQMLNLPTAPPIERY